MNLPEHIVQELIDALGAGDCPAPLITSPCNYSGGGGCGDCWFEYLEANQIQSAKVFRVAPELEHTAHTDMVESIDAKLGS